MAAVAFWGEIEVFKVPDCKKYLPSLPQRLALWGVIHLEPIQQSPFLNPQPVSSGLSLI